MAFPKYESYKDSGVEWLGEIPEHWDLQNIRAVTELKSKRNRPDFPVLSVYREYGVLLKDSRDDNHNATGLDISSYKVVEIGDLVINKMKAWQGSMGVSDYQGIVSPAYIICRVKSEKVEPKFLHYLLRSKPYIGVYNALSCGVRTGQWDMHYEDFKKIPIPLPTSEEQKRIVAFIERTTAEIDEAIAKKQHLIKLLQEQKSILINQAVTKGLNPQAPMRDSGVEWIGEIPEHWEVRKLKHLLKSMDYGLSESALSEGDYKYLNMGHIQAGRVILKNTGYLNNIPDDLILEPNDILFNRTNSFDLVGKSGIFQGKKSDNVTFASYLVRLRVTEDVEPVWFNYLLNDLLFLKYIRSLALRSLNQANLNPNRLSVVYIPTPPFEEQKKIAKILSLKETEFEQQIENIGNSINLYEELKSIYIANAVTGKIKI
ncbi:restriction endonuclease subunit S [Anabaena azotica]|uniref:Restriction endonuclease subunit S n=1 Tax=Anabaena azotica FACHB-119 TaxID=947527 RepID=A0ABR8D6D9_9NOST|nr:restriction endonuclease subunit S [Anabaena azotica]MBD2502728.1 restriction endonuclease subunit S [Anabaena azotica FACHB-119]